MSDAAPPPSILKKSKSTSTSEPTKAPTSAQAAEAQLLESQLPPAPKKERKPKRERPATEDAKPSSSKRAKKEDIPDLPQGEGKKAEKRRLRAEAQAARPPPPPAPAAKPFVWDTEKNGRNPYEDESLSDAAKKAIAYSQTIQNEFLKFQKARQNFLMRHFYTASEIPDEYLPLVLAYLKTVKGGSRDTLIASAKLILNPPPKPEPTPAPSTDDAPIAAEGDAPAPAAAVEEEPVEEEESEEVKESKKARAKQLLEVLGESTEVKKKEKKEKKSKKEKKAVDEVPTETAAAVEAEQ